MRALITTVVCAAALCVCAHACLPAPYIYITFHKGSGLQLVGAWTRDGCALPSPVSASNSGSIAEPRGMIVRTTANGNTQLLLADAGTNAGRIMQFGACGSANGGIGGRTYERDWVTESAYPGLDHPYGIAIDALTNTLYASNQDTNVVLGFGAQNAQPIPAAPYLNGTAQYAGEFAAFLASSNGVRGVTVDGNGSLWIASEDDGGVYQFDATTGAPTQFVALDSAVGVHFDNVTGFVYASSHAKDDAQVVSIDPNSGQIVQTYVAPGEKHPAGIAVYEGTVMYVVGQDTGSLFAFDVQTAAAQVVVQSLGGTGEQIVFSPC